MSKLSDYYQSVPGSWYNTSDATVVQSDLPIDVIAYGANGRLVGSIPFSATSLLLHMNGADASTVFTDSSSFAHTITPIGNAQLSTSDFKYGTAAAIFDGAGDGLSLPYVTGNFDWWTSDYTIEYWCKAASWATWATGLYPVGAGHRGADSISNYWSFGPMTTGIPLFYYYTGTPRNVTGSTALPLDVWNHVAMTLESGIIKIWVNGVLDASAAIVGTPQSSVSFPFTIGLYNNVSLNGRIDDLRITKGYAVYKSNFTPPTAEFPDA